MVSRTVQTEKDQTLPVTCQKKVYNFDRFSQTLVQCSVTNYFVITVNRAMDIVSGLINEQHFQFCLSNLIKQGFTLISHQAEREGNLAEYNEWGGL